MIPIQSRITIKLENKLEKAYPSVGGDYILHGWKENGKDYWNQEGGSYALWYSSAGFWVIGDKKNIGSNEFGKNGGLLAQELNLWIHPLKIITRANKERGKILYDINFNANNLEGMKALCLKRKKNSFHQASHRVDKESFTLNISKILLDPNSPIKISRIM